MMQTTATIVSETIQNRAPLGFSRGACGAAGWAASILRPLTAAAGGRRLVRAVGAPPPPPALGRARCRTDAPGGRGCAGCPLEPLHGLVEGIALALNVPL